MDVTADTVYEIIKSFENQFTPPGPYATIDVGTLDVDTGTFTGLKSKSVTDPEPIAHGPHDHPRNPPPRYEGTEWVSITIDNQWRRTIHSTPAPKIPLEPAFLRFSITHATSDAWSVTLNGTTRTAEPGDTSLAVNGWDSEILNWTITANGKSYSDTLRVQRPAGDLTYGALGAFTIPVLPVAVVYAPPADSKGQSSASYVEGETVGSSVTFSWSQDTTTTVDSGWSGGSVWEDFLKVMAVKLPSTASLLTTALYNVGNEFLEAGLSDKNSTGTSDSTQTKLTFTESTSTGISTSASAGGPGSGDLVHYYHNVKVGWAYFNGELRLCPFDSIYAAYPAKVLHDDPASKGLTPEDAQMLLAFDPFVSGGPDAALPADRFEQRTTFEYGNGAKIHVTDSVQRSTSEDTTHVDSTTDTTSWNLGPIVKFIFGAGTQTTTTVKVSNATGESVSTSISLDATLASGPDDSFIVTVWYDHLFGTFAFQQLQPASSARLQGSGAQPGAEVSLVSGGRAFVTVANQQGEFAFFAPTIPDGDATLNVGNATGQPVKVGGKTAPIGPGSVVTHVPGGNMRGTDT